MHRSRTRRFAASSVLGAALAAALPVAPAGADLAAQDAGAAAGIVLPARRPAGDHRAGPPELPDRAADVRPLTLEVRIVRSPRDGRERAAHQVISRTADRVHLRFEDGDEWLFARNPVDPRRVSGLRIEHARRTIVEHEESDLRNRLGVRGWADVLLLGLDVESLAGLEPTGRTRTIRGIRFVERLSQRADASVRHVWWAPEQALPHSFVVSDPAGTSRVKVERLRAGVDSALLRAPSLRFPSYRVVDLAEYLEGR